jgi:hypothetical protein
LGTVAVLARRAPPATALDLAALSAATFKASRTLSRERVGRAVTWTLAAGAANDFLEARFAALCAKANELEDTGQLTGPGPAKTG